MQKQVKNDFSWAGLLIKYFQNTWVQSPETIEKSRCGGGTVIPTLERQRDRRIARAYWSTNLLY